MLRGVLLSLLPLWSVCRGGGSPREAVAASWCEGVSAGVGYSRGEFFPCRGREYRRNDSSLWGATVRVGMIEGGDFGYDCSAVTENGRVESGDGYSKYLLSILQEILRFEAQLATSASWGFSEESNRTWGGLAGLLASNATDVVACHWAPTRRLSRIADHLVSTLETTESFVYLPQNLPLTEDVFVAAFSSKLWVFFLLSIFLLVASFLFSTHAHSTVRPDHEPWSWDEAALWAVAAVSQQSYSRHPRGSSCRTMFLIGYLVAYLFYTGFAAGITSLLALQGHQNHLTFGRIADLKLHLILHRDEYYLDFFEESGSKFADLNIRPGEGETLKQIFDKIKQTNFLGFGSTVTFLRYLREKIGPEERRGYLVVPVPNTIRRKAFLVRKSFPHKRLFNYWLLRMRENGLLDLGMKRHLRTEDAANFQTTKWFSAGLGNVFSALVFLISGWALSAVVLLAEILWRRRRPSGTRFPSALFPREGTTPGHAQRHAGPRNIHGSPPVEPTRVFGRIPRAGPVMDEDHPNVLHGPTLPLDLPAAGLGQVLYAALKTHNPYDVLMVEADSGRLVTPAEFLNLSIRVAEGLKAAGLRPGDVVSILGKAKIDVYATATGTLFQGATVSPVDQNLPPEVFRVILKETAPRFVFCDADIVDGVAEVLSQLDIASPVILYGADPESETYLPFERFIKTNPDFRTFRPVPKDDPAESVAFLVCSSGTMGFPKPVMLTDRNLTYQATVWRIISSFNKFMSCPSITFSYFFWISGIMLYVIVLCLSMEVTIVQTHEARHVLRVIDRHKPVWGIFAPALVKYLTWHPEFKNYNVSSLMLMVTGGTSLQKVVVDRVKESWGAHISCRQSYGVTEVSGSATICGMDDDVLSVGRLLPGFHMKVVSMTDGSFLGAGQQGELYLKSPSVMKGYLGNEEATESVLKDGWYKTGDVGWYTDAGTIYITGRVKDFIRFDNALISPLEIEEVILGIPGVMDAGVVGIPVDEENQLTVALVAKMPGSDLTEEDIVKGVHDALPEDKHIRGGVFFVDRIPRTPSGKMKRGDLLDVAKALYAEE